jgi:UDP-N-acetylglucosamine diphosphorylase/glucosamine-1-phosphate N-acetyltransferase
MAIVLFDNQYRKKLYPLTLTKAVADLRIGILKIKDWWQLKTGQPVFVHTENYLQPLYKGIPHDDHTWIDASLLTDNDLFDRIFSLDTNEALADDEGLIAGRLNIAANDFDTHNSLTLFKNIVAIPAVQRLENPQQVFLEADKRIREHFTLVTKGRTSERIADTNKTVQPENIFIEAGASIDHSILNASTGPIYIGKNAMVMEGSIIRGPFALGENAVVKMGTKIYGATSIGNNCVAGGEIKNSILMGFSNKAHDGYLGDSVIGEWCNFGAGTSNSNVKNTGGEVTLWSHHSASYETVGLKCGVVMGDYSRTAINSSINTGSVIGVCCNVFGEGLLPKLIHDFTWGTKNLSRYEFEKALKDIGNWKKMKGKQLTEAEAGVLQYVFDNG